MSLCSADLYSLNAIYHIRYKTSIIVFLEHMLHFHHMSNCVHVYKKRYSRLTALTAERGEIYAKTA